MANIGDGSEEKAPKPSESQQRRKDVVPTGLGGGSYLEWNLAPFLLPTTPTSDISLPVVNRRARSALTLGKQARHFCDGGSMLNPAETAALVAATKGAVDLFDRIGGQIKSVLTRRPKEAEGEDDR